ncbi:MAG TPA: DUF2254 domain-containing protein [Thermomicrobiales bacterium]|nr:DUF2254 domain-containing protein [Thermomicrobiales bacterium]
MRARSTSWWLVLRESLWFVSTLCTLVAALLAILAVQLDHRFRFDQRDDVPWWMLGGGPEGTRSVLSAIASTTITVTGVVFSIMVVAIQLASSQFSPLVLRSFRADRGNQLVLGFFIASFTYSLLVLRAVLSPLDDQPGFIPVIATTGAIVMAMISVALLIYFIHHAARSMQASSIIERASNDTLALIERLYPDDIGEPLREPPRLMPESPAAVVRATQSGYFQAIDGDTLFDLSEEHTLTVRVEHLPGAFILRGSVLASVWPAAKVDARIEDKVQTAFVIGSERTLQSDVELGIRQVAAIAVKALSPGINDPTTAALCIDRLSEALVAIGQRERPSPVRVGGDGDIRVVLDAPSFAQLLDTAFTQIRLYGARDATISAHLVGTLGQIAEMVPARCHEALANHARHVVENCRAELSVRDDVQRIERAAAWTGQPIGAGSDPSTRGTTLPVAQERSVG